MHLAKYDQLLIGNKKFITRVIRSYFGKKNENKLRISLKDNKRVANCLPVLGGFGRFPCPIIHTYANHQ